jgi:hypothetical protein
LQLRQLFLIWVGDLISMADGLGDAGRNDVNNEKRRAFGSRGGFDNFKISMLWSDYRLEWLF